MNDPNTWASVECCLEDIAVHMRDDCGNVVIVNGHLLRTIDGNQIVVVPGRPLEAPHAGPARMPADPLQGEIDTKEQAQIERRALAGWRIV